MKEIDKSTIVSDTSKKVTRSAKLVSIAAAFALFNVANAEAFSLSSSSFVSGNQALEASQVASMLSNIDASKLKSVFNVQDVATVAMPWASSGGGGTWASGWGKAI